MLKELLKQKRETSKEGFRYRGLESSRLENLTAAIFGFAITLLVISSEVPKPFFYFLYDVIVEHLEQTKRILFTLRATG